MQFDKSARFYVTEDGIPVVCGGGVDLPYCSAWDRKEPREYKLTGFYMPCSYEGFEEARISCQAES